MEKEEITEPKAEDAQKEEEKIKEESILSEAQTSPAKRRPAVFYNIRANKSLDVGQFKAEGDLFGWKSKSAKGIVQYEVPNVTFSRFAKTLPKECQLRFEFKDGSNAIFDGFKEADFPTLEAHFQKENLKVEKESIAVKGCHWGEYALEETSLSVTVEGKPLFKVRGKEVFQVEAPTKSDVAFSFNPQGIAKDEDRLVEIRIHIPAAGTGEGNHVDDIRERVLAVTGANAQVDSVVQVNDLRVMVPNGRFDFLFLKSAMKLHGKSSNFPIRYSIINKMYILPDSLTSKYILVMNLDLPIRKGQTRYNYLVVQLDEKKSVSWDLNVDEEKLKRFAAKCQEEFTSPLEGPEYSAFCKLLKALTGLKMSEPTTELQLPGDRAYVRCAHKTESGNLYALAKSFLYVFKPVINIKYDEITHVEFGNLVETHTKLFEFKIVMKGGTIYEFNSVDRQDYQPFVDFLQSKSIKVRATIQQLKAQAMVDVGESEEDESDEEYDAGDDNDSSSGSDDEDEEDENENEGDEGGESRTPKSVEKKRKKKEGKSSEKSPGKSSSKKRKRDSSTSKTSKE
eukprot:GHVP01010719.1.p1 GENE.GHVP01010719.1~~GHVP01010719.1.p1  ORF type:complete len:586 (-),score=117.45 GHVP01010719.1:82-1779(-)